MAIPERTIRGLMNYVSHGRRPGDFLYSFLTNNLYEASIRADDENAQVFVEITRWLKNSAPINCYGSVTQVRAWLGADQEVRDSCLKHCGGWQEWLEEYDGPDLTPVV